MTNDITGLHHVGHVVRDMSQAMERYRQLGFTVPPPAYPVLPSVEGGSAEPFGVANTHVYFARNFIELVAVADDSSHLPTEARPMPLQVPDDKLRKLTAAIRATVDNIRSFLQRFQGVHIVIADTPDIDSVAARLAAAGVSHGGVHAVQRPVETSAGTRLEPARFLEISDPDLPAGQVPEGRIGCAQNASAEAQSDQRHPNGATELVECVLCVDDSAWPEWQQRYATYFGRPQTANVTLVTASALADLLPGERPAVLPAFVAYAVDVRDIAATEQVLRDNDVPIARTGRGELFVPATAALGAAIIFRQLRPGLATLGGVP